MARGPSSHWVHHHDLGTDTESNYGTIFSFWDPLFGSRGPTPVAVIWASALSERRPELPFRRLLASLFLPRPSSQGEAWVTASAGAWGWDRRI